VKENGSAMIATKHQKSKQTFLNILKLHMWNHPAINVKFATKSTEQEAPSENTRM